jgi:anti-sigma-K factor RskA
MCAECAEGFYRLNGMCEKCPDWAWALLLGAAVMVAMLGAAFVYLQKKRVNLAAAVIAVDFLQVVTLVSSFDFGNIPIELRLVYLYISGFSFNVELLAPECT